MFHQFVLEINVDHQDQNVLKLEKKDVKKQKIIHADGQNLMENVAKEDVAKLQQNVLVENV